MSSYEEGGILGHQMPRISHLVPSRRSVGLEIVDLAELAGLKLDPWQSWIMHESGKVREDQNYFNEYTGRFEPKWAAFEVGVVVSRQNGKGSILEARELAGLFIFGERLIIHSAHQFDTSKEAFERVLSLIMDTPELKAEVAHVRWSHGEEGIELKNGQRLRFRTRTKGGGRGFTADCLILDEAMYLGSQAVGALMPTLSARPNAQLWYTGSAGDKDSTQLGRVRSRALRGNDPRLFYAEWSINAHNDFCAPDCEDHDPSDTVESYAKANPGLGIRISVEHVQNEQRSMDDATFAQERLGVGDWPGEGEEWQIISRESWMARVNEASAIEGDFVLAIDTTPDSGYTCVSAAGFNADGETHIEITSDGERTDHRPGVHWVEDAVLQICKAMHPKAVVIDKVGQAGAFVDGLTGPLEKLGIQLLHPNSREYAQSCGMFYAGIVPKKGNVPNIVHIEQPTLTAAVAGADQRELTDMWAWNKRLSSVDISPLVASTLAVWGLRKVVTEKQASAPWVVRR